MARKRKVGRPRSTVRRTAQVMVRLTRAEKLVRVAAARAAGQKLSEWMRSVSEPAAADENAVVQAPDAAPEGEG